MTVYELIQQLSKYKADTEVTFHVNANLSVDVEAEFDRENADDVQIVTVDTTFDADIDFDEIEDRERKIYRDIVVNLYY